jgi:hypothetical protein
MCVDICRLNHSRALRAPDIAVAFRHGGAIIIARATRLYHLRPFAKWRSFRGAVMHGPGSPLGGPLVSQTCAAGRRTLSDRTD